MARWNFEPVLTRLRGAAYEPSLWSDALDALSRSVGGAGAAVYSRRARPMHQLTSPDLLEVTADYIKNGWRAHDIRVRAVPIGLSAGAVVDQDFVTPEEMRRSPFYEEFLAGHDRRWFAGVAFDEAGDFGLTIHRSAAQGPFLADEVSALRRLAPDFVAAISLAGKLGFARVEGLTQALELLGRPCVALDEGGRLLRANTPGEALLSVILDAESRTLVFAERASQAAYDTAIAAALGAPGASRLVSVRDRTGASHALSVVPLNDTTRHPFAGAGVLVMFERRAPPEMRTLATLRELFGLTPSEARLARELHLGRSLAAAARGAGVTYETARSYLKAIFSKTGTRRQAELTALLVRCLNPDV